MLRNFIQIVSEGIRMDGTGLTVVYIVLALALSAVVWWACTHYTKLWNTVYHVTPSFHVLCCVAAVVTFFATLCFIGLKNMKPVSERIVEEWGEEVMDDYELSEKCFRESYYAIKDTGMEDIQGYRAPENGGNLIPISRRETRILVGEIYAGNACRDFARRNPFIGYFIKADEGVPSEIIAEDVDSFFRSRNADTYPLERGFVLAIRQITSDLQAQCGKIVRHTRWWLFLVFLLVQSIPFGAIGYLAWRDLKNHKRTEADNDHDDFDFDF